MPGFADSMNDGQVTALLQFLLTPEVLHSLGVISKQNGLIKVLGVGELTTAITVHAHKFSETAQQKITAAGGKAEIIEVKQPAAIKRGKK